MFPAKFEKELPTEATFAPGLSIPEDYKKAVFADTRPEGAIEHEYAERLLFYGWHIRAVRAAEARALTSEVLDGDSPERTRHLQWLARYRREMERSYERAVRELKHLQTQRAVLLQQEREAITAVSRVAPLAELTRLTDLTDPFFRTTHAVDSKRDMQTSREAGQADYDGRVARFRARKAAEATAKAA